MILHKDIKRIKPKTLIKEALFLLRKKGRYLDENSKKAVEEAVSALEAKSKSGATDEILCAKEALREAIIQHMARRTYDIVADFFRALIMAIVIALLFRQFIIEPFEIPTGSMVPTLKVGDKILVSKFAYGLNIPFINTKVLGFNKPKRWEVVVFTTRNIRDSSDIERNFVKRVVGLPGETIMIQNGEIFGLDTDQDGKEVMTHIPKPDYIEKLSPDYCYYYNIDEGKTSGIELYDTTKWLGIVPIHVPSGDARMVTWKYGLAGQKIRIPPGHYFMLGDNSRDSFDSRGWGFVPIENIRGKVICKWRFLPPWGDGFVR